MDSQLKQWLIDTYTDMSFSSDSVVAEVARTIVEALNTHTSWLHLSDDMKYYQREIAQSQPERKQVTTSVLDVFLTTIWFFMKEEGK